MAHVLLVTFSVALLTESVDRNFATQFDQSTDWKSLSSRRAWIEIELSGMPVYNPKESLSSRRAWIEISSRGWKPKASLCRSPHGERG